eukprot:2610936-Pleurochrysis_carterae.AAC.1
MRWQQIGRHWDWMAAATMRKAVQAQTSGHERACWLKVQYEQDSPPKASSFKLLFIASHCAVCSLYSLPHLILFHGPQSLSQPHLTTSPLVICA